MEGFIALLFLLVFFVGVGFTINALVVGFAETFRTMDAKSRQARQQRQLDEITQIKLGAIRDMDALSRRTVDAARKLYDESKQNGWR